ncbi:MAG: hypothetical protein Unbinned767contig1000_35 [Prokaryotic dsDNA virus sp.]|nr:MAG: hypothetical protein Unbinned767contig1000_35 [Prokaryotic dsDNA virus sp.]
MSDSTDTGGWDKLPAVPKALLEELERRMGEFNPSLDTPDRKIWFELGRRDFLRFLRRVFDYQHNVH